MPPRTTIHELLCTTAGNEISAAEARSWLLSFEEIPADAQLRAYGQHGAVYRIEVRIPEQS